METTIQQLFDSKNNEERAVKSIDDNKYEYAAKSESWYLDKAIYNSKRRFSNL